MPEKRIECFKHFFDHLAWIGHQYLSGLRDPRKPGSLWGMRIGVRGVRKTIHQSWLAKELGLWLREFSKRFNRKRPALFESGQWHFHQDNAPVPKSILVRDYLTKMGMKTVLQPPYSRDLAPCDFWLFTKPRDCRYETIEEMKEAVTRPHKRTSMGPSRSCWNGTRRALQPEELTSKGTKVSRVYYQ